LRGCGQPDITIRPHQEQPVSLQTGAFHAGLSAELVECYLALDAYRTNFWLRAAVDLHLPGE
jgi:hypothetical protein